MFLPIMHFSPKLIKVYYFAIKIVTNRCCPVHVILTGSLGGGEYLGLAMQCVS